MIGNGGGEAGNEMDVLILGGGVVGITTAYQLQKDGHAVTVLEQAGQVAEGAS
ncbi:MAG: FAD-dependent oxidoreductase, partial [Bacteroidota bacterium]